MATTVTDHRTVWDEADSVTGWTGGSPSLVTSDPNPVEPTGHIGNVVSTATVDCFFTGTATSLTNKLVYAWALPLGAMDTIALGGVAILAGDGTNRVGYHLAGSDVAVFRHNSGQPFYECLVLDQASLPTQKTVRAGLEASLAWSAITQIGVMFKTLQKSKGGVANCFVDIIRILDLSVNNGCAASISGGTSISPSTFDGFATLDADSSTNLQSYGLCRKLGAGTYGLQGPIRFGIAGAASWFADTNVTVVFEARGMRTTVYKLAVIDDGVLANTSTFKLGTKVGSGVSATGKDGVVITAAAGVGWRFDAQTSAAVDNVFIYGSTFNGAEQGVKLQAGQEFIGGTISNSGAIDLGTGAVFTKNSVPGSTVAADASAVIWNNANDPDTFLDGTSISKGTAAHHAIEFGLTSPLTMTLRNMTFVGFNAANGATDSTLHIKRTTGTVTINVIGGTTPSYKTAGATVNIVANPVSVTITVKDVSGTAIQNANVYLPVASGGPFPFQVTVTIVNSGTTATVTHTAHGMATNDQVRIKGASLTQNNGVFTITVTDANTYTYTMSSAPGSSPTGTITSTFVLLKGLTDVNGQITMSRVFPSDQPISGQARKSSATPFYKTAIITGTVSSSTGFSANALMVLDE